MARVRDCLKRGFRKITGRRPKQPDIPPVAPSANNTPNKSSATDNNHHQEQSRDSIPFTSPISPVVPSASNTAEDSTATGTKHAEQNQSGDSPTSTYSIPPPAPSARITLEDSAVTGIKHIEQKQSGGVLSFTTPANQQQSPAAQSLWDQAYNALAKENPKLVKRYDELLAKEEPLANSAPNETTPLMLPAPHVPDTRPDRSPRQVQLDTVIRNGLRRMEDNKATYTIAGHEFDLTSQITKAAKFLDWSKDLIGSAVKYSPEASIVWSGVCLVLPLLTNPTTAAEANQGGFVYVTSRLHYYIALEPMVRRLGVNASVDEALVSAANAHILDLYQAILDFQISSVLRFYQSRLKTYARDVFTMKDWEQTRIDIKTLEDTVNDDLGQINQLAARQELERLNTTSEDARAIMENCLSVATQHLAVAGEHLAVSGEQLAVLKLQQAAQDDAKREMLLVERRKCLQAFCLTQNSNGITYEWYKSRVESRVEGTCKWFLQHENFQKWLSQDSGPLLVSADPGCGKSVLAKYLIDHGLAQQSATISYFFFKDQDQNTTRQALCALLHQLFRQKSALIQHAMKLYNELEATLVQFEASLWTILRDAVRDPQAGPVIFVIDALDECDESHLKSLVTNLKDIFHDQQLANAKFKVLMTSRPYDQVVRKFRSLQDDFPHIHIPGEEEFEAITQEINIVIQHRVEQLAQEHWLSDKIKSTLNRKLLAIEHRTYLWVFLVFDYLDKGFKTTEDGINAAIQELPESVNQAYDQILNRSQNAKTAKTVKKVLSIILAARRPLTLSEMNIAMNLDGPSGGRTIYDLDLEQDSAFKTRLRRLCGLFVNVHHDRVYFLHHTAREFLIQSSAPTTVSSDPQWHHSITTRHAHSVLAEICMFYLDRLNSTHTESFRESDHHGALVDYSVKYWGGHCRQAEFESGSAMVDLASGLCTPDLTSRSKWASIASERYHIRPGSSAYVWIASRLGLTAVTELLLSRGADIEAKDSRGITALILAANSGHEAVAHLLLDKGADVEARDNLGWTALMLAATHGHEAIVRLLLEKGADVEVKKDNGATALIVAAANGHEAVTRLLLDKGADVGAKDNDGWTALIHAARSGHEAVARLLLDEGADVEAKMDGGGTALMVAAANGHKSVARLLLDEGADVEAKDSDGGTALMLAATHGHEAIVRLLLEKGADVEVKKDNGATALMAAAANGHSEVAGLLLDKDADIEAREHDGVTALMLAATAGHEAVAHLLLEKGADVEAKTDDGGTALMLAVAIGHEAVARLLLDKGADVEMKYNDGGTALMAAAANGHEAVARLLLEKGTDVEAKNNDGWTALIYAAVNGHEAVARLMLENGADAVAKDNDGWTALRHVTEGTTRLLLDNGTQDEAKDVEGSTASLLAAKNNFESVRQLLLEKTVVQDD